jgi:hypothetical protein
MSTDHRIIDVVKQCNELEKRVRELEIKPYPFYAFAAGFLVPITVMGYVTIFRHFWYAVL